MLRRIINKLKGAKEKIRTDVRLTTPSYIDRHKGRDFLVLASGASLKEQRDQVQRFIEQKNPIIMAGNFIDNMFVPDYHGFTNRKRFIAYIKSINSKSNVLLSPYFATYIIKENYRGKYEEIVFDDQFTLEKGRFEIKEGIIYSSGASVGTILLGVAIVMGAENIYVAGMDGYSKSSSSHFYNEQDNKNMETLLIQERLMTEQLRDIRDILKKNKRGRLAIITKTAYDEFYEPI